MPINPYALCRNLLFVTWVICYTKQSLIFPLPSSVTIKPSFLIVFSIFFLRIRFFYLRSLTFKSYQSFSYIIE